MTARKAVRKAALLELLSVLMGKSTQFYIMRTDLFLHVIILSRGLKLQSDRVKWVMVPQLSIFIGFAYPLIVIHWNILSEIL